MNRTNRAFSLIEILIAIIILALGLLGIGAVFPIVIREQRIAQDRVLATVASENVRSTLRGIDQLDVSTKTRYEPAINNLDVTQPELTAVYRGWAIFQEDWHYQRAWNEVRQSALPNSRPDFVNGDRFNFSAFGEWSYPWLSVSNDAAPQAQTEYAMRGRFVFSSVDNVLVAEENDFPVSVVEARRNALRLAGAANTTIGFFRRFEKFSIPLASRINLTTDVSDENPGYVWDFIARRKLETDDPRALQVAVFVRRVDPRLRPVPRTTGASPGNETVSIREQILSASLPAVQHRLPVGETFNGIPTLDGTGQDARTPNYSAIHQIGAYFIDDPLTPYFRKRDKIYIDVSYPTAQAVQADGAMVAQLGQRVVDNLGNIYTVTGYDQIGVGAYYIKVDPPVPMSVLDSGNLPPQLPGDPAPAVINQLIFTPQIPISVFVTEIQP